MKTLPCTTADSLYILMMPKAHLRQECIDESSFFATIFFAKITLNIKIVLKFMQEDVNS